MIEFLSIAVLVAGLFAVLYGAFGRTEWDNMKGGCKRAP